jgi:hypothetical protein
MSCQSEARRASLGRPPPIWFVFEKRVQLRDHVNYSLIATVVCVLALSPVAHAQTSDSSPSVEEIKAAETDFNKGREAYKTGDYGEAAEYFESADGHAPNDRVLELAITAREKAGNGERAATLAQYGLDTYPNSERLRKVAPPLLERAHADFLQINVACDEACNLLEGSHLVHGGPSTHRTLFVAPGDYSIRAAWSDDRALSKPASGAAGASVELSFAAPPIPRKPEALVTSPSANPASDQGAVASSRTLPPIYFLIGVGATVVLGGVTLWSGIDTVNNPGADAVRKACVGQGDGCPEYKDGRSKQLRTNILIGATSVVGVATSIVGGFFTNFRGKPSRDSKSASVAPWVSYDNGPALGAAGRF